MPKTWRAHGGLITLQDLREYEIHDRTPVRGTYRGYEIVSAPPTSSGGTHIVQMLNLLEAFDIAAIGFGTAAYIHLLSEVLKIAYADRFEYMADPAFAQMPIAGLTSKEYARVRRGDIDRARPSTHRAGDPAPFSGESVNTTHLTVADDQGNVVAMTQTINELFGSKVTVPGTGLILNNTMALFDPHPGNANSIAPHKRMLSSVSPTVVLKDGKPFMALGTPGGTRIFPAVLQAIINVVDFGMTLQEAVEAPRVWTQGQALQVEPGHRRGDTPAASQHGPRVGGRRQGGRRHERGVARPRPGTDSRRGLLAGRRRSHRHQRRPGETRHRRRDLRALSQAPRRPSGAAPRLPQSQPVARARARQIWRILLAGTRPTNRLNRALSTVCT